MAKTHKPPFPQDARNNAQRWESGDPATSKNMLVAAADDTRVDSLGCTSTCAAAAVVMEVYLFETATSTSVIITTVSVPANAGTDGITPAVDLLSGVTAPWINEDGSLTLQTGWTLRARNKAAIPAGGSIAAFCFGGDY